MSRKRKLNTEEIQSFADMSESEWDEFLKIIQMKTKITFFTDQSSPVEWQPNEISEISGIVYFLTYW